MVLKYFLRLVIINIIRQILQSKHKISPRAKLFWNAKISDITTWSNPYRFSILNNVKEVHNHVKSCLNSWTLTALVVSVTGTRKTRVICFRICDLSLGLMLVPFYFCKEMLIICYL